ncbi:MarR family winged helix-turn-helix transcriptional regulator [Desulforamulus ruminis]|uniref:Regulatory protein MarR n=1 Tax=Desulforamulus ruminis (strain ATCC 23193 / DSM 2154 / NCIMB 8452 / DL) TaxID=696281 RepID=F6DUJ0_DESRL|nr:MarR family transcriptional regulator [Desulforamulus ruminis]AEG59057.1 regulatory protein MarR [Desulforamulus ruminis DSM 2154]
MKDKEGIDFDIEKSAGFLLAKCHQKGLQIFREKLLPHNLTPPQFATLAFLWKKDGQSQIQLGTTMEMDRTTISGIIDRLENQGLVNRRQHLEDRRVFMIHLTEDGRKLEQVLSLLSLEANKELTLNLSAEERETFLTLLKKIRGELNAKQDRGSC